MNNGPKLPGDIDEKEKINSNAPEQTDTKPADTTTNSDDLNAKSETEEIQETDDSYDDGKLD